MDDESRSLPPEIARYRAALAAASADAAAVDTVRFVALDCETTGTDAERDRIVTIGAVTVRDGEILLEEQFEGLVQVTHNTSSVLVHGVTAEQAAREGVTEDEAMRGFLDFLGGGVIVGHHIGFDVTVLGRACERCFGLSLGNRWIDTMELTLHLEAAGVLDALPVPGGTRTAFPDFTLDGLCRRFAINPHDRHTASGDAFITAQIFLKLLRLARRAGRTTLGALAERWVDPNAG